MLSSLDIVAPTYREAVLASRPASYWPMGEALPTITIATLVTGAAAVPDVSPAVNEVQTITLANATAGTFTLTFGANTTSALAYNVTAALMQTALTGLASIGANNATVTLSGLVYTVTFVGALAATDVAALTYTSSIGRHAASLIAMDFEGSADFDGSTGYVTLGDNYDFTGLVPFTVSCWCNADTLAASLRIVDKDDGTNGWHLEDNSGSMTLTRRASGADGGTAPGVIGAGATANVVATWDGALMFVYVNGQFKAGGSNPKASVKSLSNTTAVLTFGRRSTVSSNFFDGRIDEIVIWNRALAMSEVLRLYEIGRG